VLVQPSFYGVDNSCLLAALKVLGDDARAVAVLPADVAGDELDRLHALGVRGIRINAVSIGAASHGGMKDALTAGARICERHGWHLQLLLPPAAIVSLKDSLLNSPVEVVLDHFGLVPAAPGHAEAASHVVALLDTGRCWVKLSAPYRIASDMRSPAVTALARMMADANPERVLFATDWPHTPVHKGTLIEREDEMPYRDIDTGMLVQLLFDWFPEQARQQQILVRNPEKLYGFEPAASMAAGQGA
jgi:predicted TIM-barrel fold metal-dependent hydrolase